jgi:hypothetical protein
MTKAAIALVGLLALSAGNVAAQEPAPRDSVPRAMLDRAARSNWYLRTVTVDAPHDTIAGRRPRSASRPRLLAIDLARVGAPPLRHKTRYSFPQEGDSLTGQPPDARPA